MTAANGEAVSRGKQVPDKGANYGTAIFNSEAGSSHNRIIKGYIVETRKRWRVSDQEEAVTESRRVSEKRS